MKTYVKVPDIELGNLCSF